MQCVIFVIFYIIFELLHYILSNKFTFNEIYFILHVIVNTIIIILCISCSILFFDDPLGLYLTNESCPEIYYNYPILASLHVLHMRYNINHIDISEMIHHILSFVFWGLTNYLNHPIYILSLVGMSGIAGGITYLLLFLVKQNIINKITEKQISTYLNLWIRQPLCSIFAIIFMTRLCYIDDKYSYFDKICIIFMAFFTFINGTYFMKTILRSYYSSYSNYSR